MELGNINVMNIQAGGFNKCKINSLICKYIFFSFWHIFFRHVSHLHLDQPFTPGAEPLLWLVPMPSGSATKKIEIVQKRRLNRQYCGIHLETNVKVQLNAAPDNLLHTTLWRESNLKAIGLTWQEVIKGGLSRLWVNGAKHELVSHPHKYQCWL